MLGEVKFKSGVSIGEVLTKTIQFVEHIGITYGYTPGLSDVKYRKEARNHKILKKNGICKLFFVASVESGRVRPDDITTIHLILNAIQIKVNYSMIINKCTKMFFEEIKNKEKIQKIYASFNSGKHKTEYSIFSTYFFKFLFGHYIEFGTISPIILWIKKLL